jgi:hypothetical protein
MMKDMVNDHLDSDNEDSSRDKIEQAKELKENAKKLKASARDTDAKCSEDFRERMMQKADNMRQRHKKELYAVLEKHSVIRSKKLKQRNDELEVILKR